MVLPPLFGMMLTVGRRLRLRHAAATEPRTGIQPVRPACGLRCCGPPRHRTPSGNAAPELSRVEPAIDACANADEGRRVITATGARPTDNFALRGLQCNVRTTRHRIWMPRAPRGTDRIPRARTGRRLDAACGKPIPEGQVMAGLALRRNFRPTLQLSIFQTLRAES